MKKHYEEQVIVKYIGHRQYEVTASEILVTESKGEKPRRKQVREIQRLFTEPTIWTSFLEGESLAELCRRRIVAIDEEFKLYDFDKINVKDISDALQREAQLVGRVLPQFFVM